MTEAILTEVAPDGAATLTLNRPRTINSLNRETLEAIASQLAFWARDDQVAAVELRGAGERGLCAGADIKELATTVVTDGPWQEYLELEYALDQVMAGYPKPTTSYMLGITMGGGLGLASAADHRVVNETSLMAMPETKIGLFPDAGSLYRLSRAGNVGKHVALTAATFNGGDAMRMNFADESLSGDLPAPLHETDWIAECYDTNDLLDVAYRLERHPNPDANLAAKELRARSPLAVHVTWHALRRAAALTYPEVLAQDLVLATRLIPQGDFAEGVRALLIDKDQTPEWRFGRLEDVPTSLVAELGAD